ncbi:MAG: cytochrome c oxidase subunit II [Chloroflexi bacterium]|nr:cytochrome c oxidase subunit II [Chloroflexota bacterium]
MNRHAMIVGALWVVFTIAGEAVVLSFSPFPVAASEQAAVVDDAFTLLTLMAVPVFSLVCAMLLYSGLRFGQNSQPDQDGPPTRNNKSIVWVWLFVTTVLTIVMIIHPGITGILDLRADDDNIDLVVQLEARQYFWNVKFPDAGVRTTKELVLPIDENVQFLIMAHDVLHSFWVPAFRVKIDAVPGMFTKVTATPNELGSFDDDVNFRIQCAELCGVGHATMQLPVRVVERAEFDQWLTEQKPIAARR